MCHFRCPWNGMFDCHRAEINAMQFTGHSLPVHQFVAVPRDFNHVPYCQPSSPTPIEYALPPSLEWRCRRSIYNIISLLIWTLLVYLYSPYISVFSLSIYTISVYMYSSCLSIYSLSIYSPCLSILSLPICTFLYLYSPSLYVLSLFIYTLPAYPYSPSLIGPLWLEVGAPDRSNLWVK